MEPARLRRRVSQLRRRSGGSSFSSQQDYPLRAGDGLFFGTGVLIPVTPTFPQRFEAQLGVSYLNQTTRDQQNSVSWTRVPLEAIYYYHHIPENFRAGWGVTYHVGNSMKGKGTHDTVNYSVPNSWGWVIAAEKLFNMNPARQEAGYVSVGVRYAAIAYRSDHFDGGRVSGNAAYLTLGVESP